MKTSHEDIFFYLDLTKDILKKKELIKAIKYYISEKNKINLKGHYGLLVFQEQGNPIFIIDKKDSNFIANAIEENWRTRPKKESFFENGLFYIFSYISETVRKKSKINRIIVITDTPSDLSEDYTDALFNLVSKIKDFPTFIDIIRISEKSERFFKDDVKLNILTSDTKGEIFYTHDKKTFMNVISTLVGFKQIPLDFKAQQVKIKKEDYDFYSNLAKVVKPTSKDETGVKCVLCQEEICPVCTNIYDIPFKCENCGIQFHNCCITNYAIQHNIGIPHIFRCPKCDILLKIKQDQIVACEDDKVESVEEYIEDGFIEKPIELEKEYKEISKEEIFEPTYNQTTDPKAVRIGGFFGKLYTVRKEGDKLIYRKFSQNSAIDEDKTTNLFEPKIGHEKEKYKESKVWKPLNDQDSEVERLNGNIIICPECGSHITKYKEFKSNCPYCGHKF